MISAIFNKFYSDPVRHNWWCLKFQRTIFDFFMAIKTTSSAVNMTDESRDCLNRSVIFDNFSSLKQVLTAVRLGTTGAALSMIFFFDDNQDPNINLLMFRISSFDEPSDGINRRY